MERIADALERAGYSTYLPHRDGVEAFVMNAVNRPLSNLLVFRPIVRLLSRATFALDIHKVLKCDHFVFNMNGGVPDEGGAVETGVAFAAGKPVVLYSDDARRPTGGRYPMLVGATGTFEVADSVESLPAAVEEASQRLRLLGRAAGGCVRVPPFVERVARSGAVVERVLRALAFLRPANMMSPRETLPCIGDRRDKGERV